MQAIKKQLPITVQIFDPQQPPWPLNVHVRTPARQPGAPHAYAVWNVQHKIYIPLEPGDYVNVTNADDTFPIKPDVFMATYDLIADGAERETDSTTDDDRALLAAIQSAPDDTHMLELLVGYWRADVDRANRTPRPYVYLHLGMLAGTCARLLHAIAAATAPHEAGDSER